MTLVFGIFIFHHQAQEKAASHNKYWWLDRNVSRRQQSVCAQLAYGVPQGSIPGPLFFLLHTDFLVTVSTYTFC